MNQITTHIIKLKKWLTAVGVSSITVSLLIAILMTFDVFSRMGIGTQGSAKTLVVSLCLSAIFFMFGLLCFKNGRIITSTGMSDEDIVNVVGGVFSIFKVLACFVMLITFVLVLGVFLPTY